MAAYAIHKNTQTIQKYARRNPIHLHRRVAQADTPSTVIEGLYDPDAAAHGAPSVRWFLGYDADGAPQFCGLPAHHTCPHRMGCSRCGLFIGGERPKLVHDDPKLLRVTADIPMTEVQRRLNLVVGIIRVFKPQSRHLPQSRTPWDPGGTGAGISFAVSSARAAASRWA